MSSYQGQVTLILAVCPFVVMLLHFVSDAWETILNAVF